MSREILVSAPAKVNLFLGAGEVMEDGYHHLDVVFHALALRDEVRIAPAAELTVKCEADLGIPHEENLVFTAALAMSRAFDRALPFEIDLIKHVPHGSGLGGGSSDAAAVIAGIAYLWDVDPHDPRCLAAAVSVGADVPFFLYGGAALMTGRGDTLVRRLPALDTPVVLVRPPMPVPTAAAYRAFDENPVPRGDSRGVVEALEHHDSHALGRALENNFEEISIGLVPQVGEALSWIRQQRGVLGAIVAGSGSAVFALMEDDEEAHTVQAEAARLGLWAAATRLERHGAHVVHEEGDR